MNRLLSFTTLGVITLTAHVVQAQSAETGAAAVVEGAGVRVGEGTVLHPILGVESGVVQNVFYEDNNTNVSGLLRIIGELAVGSLPSERMQLAPGETDDVKNYGDLAFRGDLHLQYDQYLSGNDRVMEQSGVSGYASAQGIVFPRQTWQFGFGDVFARTIRPLNFESSENIQRITNTLSLDLRYRPKGRTISGLVGYANSIDYFEEDRQQFANRIAHRFRLNVGWQWLPVTRIYGDASVGIVGPFGELSTRPSSVPVKAVVGIATALTVKTAVNARIGFGKGFYSEEDFTNVIGGVTFSWRPSPELKFSAGYDYDFEDSINANFYRDHAIKLRADYRRDRFTLTADTALRFRLYRGIIDEVMSTETDRDDLIFSIGAGAAYNFKNWIAATADYQVAIDQTNFRYNPEAGLIDDPSYVRQTLLLGVRAAY